MKQRGANKNPRSSQSLHCLNRRILKLTSLYYTIKTEKMKRYYKQILAIALACNGLVAMSQNTDKLTAEPGSVILNIHAAPAITQLNSSKYSSYGSMKPGFIGGFDVVYYFKTYKQINIGVSLGLNYSYYSSGIKLNYNDSLWTTDSDNESAHVFEKGNNLSETQKVSAIDIPLLLHFDYPVAAKFDVYLNTGAYISMFVSQKYSTATDYTAKGYYPKYNATFFNVDVPNSPYYFPTNKALSNSGTLKLKSNIGLQLALGCKYSISPAVAITAGLNTYLGLKNISDYKDADQTPLVNADRQINSLLSQSSNIKANAYCIELGVAIKLGVCKKSKSTAYETPVYVEAKKDIIPVEKPVVKDTVKKEIVKIDIVSTVLVKKEAEVAKIPVSGKIDGNNEANLVFKSLKDTVNISTINGEYSTSLFPEMYDVEVSAKGCIPVVSKLDLKNKTASEPVMMPEVKVQKLEKGTMFKFDKVNFVSGTDNLSAESFAVLDLICKTSKENPTMQMDVAGHTDNIGSDVINKALSLKRANAVVNYLISKGANPAQFKARGYGATMPIADNKTAEGRAQNRRVEYTITGL